MMGNEVVLSDLREAIETPKFRGEVVLPLLYINPKASEKLKEPITDELTKVVAFAKSRAIEGTYRREEERFNDGGGWKGEHTTDCWTISSSCDYLLENGYATNSLCVFYLQWYRNSIPPYDLKVVKGLKRFYEDRGIEIKVFPINQPKRMRDEDIAKIEDGRAERDRRRNEPPKPKPTNCNELPFDLLLGVPNKEVIRIVAGQNLDGAMIYGVPWENKLRVTIGVDVIVNMDDIYDLYNKITNKKEVE